ncbi:hypothetical protein GPECTOR_2g1195 [Gonium pectorale]|uniref:PWI domain-containing protein n=1 Tax=Gonium pectorale TaxID=33097 RepID=A0A150H0P4_GONPE|nr:hypothetical protein GPECTOR_2g1195 [Gonium pectorale]|eukprot:KXZ55645.1 hypothetical protein GPECTOR_2g1195 [Gonium pectorale]
MSGLGGLRGVSANQDGRFSDKQKKTLKDLIKSGKVPKELELKVDLKKVNWPVMKEWIAKRITQLLGGLEEEVLISMVYNHLEEPEMDGKKLYVNLVPFLEKNTSLFCKELWLLLHSANQTASHIPQQMLDAEAERQRQLREQQEKIQAELEARRIAAEAERAAQLLAAQQQLQQRREEEGTDGGQPLPPPPPRGERRERRGWEPRDPEPSAPPREREGRHRWEPRDIDAPPQPRRERRGWEPREPEPDRDRGRPSRWDSGRGRDDREREREKDPRDGRDRERASRDRIGGRMRAHAKRSRSRSRSPSAEREKHGKAAAEETRSPVREVAGTGVEDKAPHSAGRKERHKKEKKEHKKEKSKKEHKKEKKEKRKKKKGEGEEPKSDDEERAGGGAEAAGDGSDGEPSDPELAELRAKALQSARSL